MTVSPLLQQIQAQKPRDGIPNQFIDLIDKIVDKIFFELPEQEVIPQFLSKAFVYQVTTSPEGGRRIQLDQELVQEIVSMGDVQTNIFAEYSKNSLLNHYHQQVDLYIDQLKRAFTPSFKNFLDNMDAFWKFLEDHRLDLGLDASLREELKPKIDAELLKMAQKQQKLHETLDLLTGDAEERLLQKTSDQLSSSICDQNHSFVHYFSQNFFSQMYHIGKKIHEIHNGMEQLRKVDLQASSVEKIAVVPAFVYESLKKQPDAIFRTLDNVLIEANQLDCRYEISVPPDFKTIFPRIASLRENYFSLVKLKEKLCQWLNKEQQKWKKNAEDFKTSQTTAREAKECFQKIENDLINLADSHDVGFGRYQIALLDSLETIRNSIQKDLETDFHVYATCMQQMVAYCDDTTQNIPYQLSTIVTQFFQQATNGTLTPEWLCDIESQVSTILNPLQPRYKHNGQRARPKSLKNIFSSTIEILPESVKFSLLTNSPQDIPDGTPISKEARDKIRKSLEIPMKNVLRDVRVRPKCTPVRHSTLFGLADKICSPRQTEAILEKDHKISKKANLEISKLLKPLVQLFEQLGVTFAETLLQLPDPDFDAVDVALTTDPFTTKIDLLRKIDPELNLSSIRKIGKNILALRQRYEHLSDASRCLAGKKRTGKEFRRQFLKTNDQIVARNAKILGILQDKIGGVDPGQVQEGLKTLDQVEASHKKEAIQQFVRTVTSNHQNTNSFSKKLVRTIKGMMKDEPLTRLSAGHLEFFFTSNMPLPLGYPPLYFSDRYDSLKNSFKHYGEAFFRQLEKQLPESPLKRQFFDQLVSIGEIYHRNLAKPTQPEFIPNEQLRLSALEQLLDKVLGGQEFSCDEYPDINNPELLQMLLEKMSPLEDETDYQRVFEKNVMLGLLLLRNDGDQPLYDPHKYNQDPQQWLIPLREHPEIFTFQEYSEEFTGFLRSVVLSNWETFKTAEKWKEFTQRIEERSAMAIQNLEHYFSHQLRRDRENILTILKNWHTLELSETEGVLKQQFEELVESHDALKTVFPDKLVYKLLARIKDWTADPSRPFSWEKFEMRDTPPYTIWQTLFSFPAESYGLNWREVANEYQQSAHLHPLERLCFLAGKYSIVTRLSGLFHMPLEEQE